MNLIYVLVFLLYTVLHKYFEIFFGAQHGALDLIVETTNTAYLGRLFYPTTERQ